MAILKGCSCRRLFTHLRILLWGILFLTLFCLILFNTYLTHEEKEKYYIPAAFGVKNVINRLISRNTSDSTKLIHGLHPIPQDKDFPYHYILNEPDFCNTRSNLRIINAVQVAAGDLSSREHIRRLWGSENWRNKTGMSTVFVLGITNNNTVMEQVKEESHRFHDIIQVSFVDSYDNLTLKTLSSLHWTKQFCQNAEWFLKSDTDVFINTFRLSRFLFDSGSVTSELICRVKPENWRYPCRRNCKEPKWQISYQEFPENKFPPHCQGPAYIIPRSVVGSLYEASNKSHPFRFEDVYYTGLLVPLLPMKVNWNDIADKFPWRPTKWDKSFTQSDLMVLEMEEGCGKGSWDRAWKEVLEMENIAANKESQPELKETEYPVLMWISVVIILLLIFLIMTPCIQSFIKR